MSKDSRQLAVALAYQTGQAAPKVVAKGRGLLAQAIIERAKDAGRNGSFLRIGLIEQWRKTSLRLLQECGDISLTGKPLHLMRLVK